MRALFISLLLISAFSLRAQSVELPRVVLPSVELPRVEMPVVELPGFRTRQLRDGGQVRTATGIPAGSWERTVFSDRIQLIDPSGSSGIELKRSITGEWEPIVPTGSDPWSMDEDTGTLRKNF